VTGRKAVGGKGRTSIDFNEYFAAKVKKVEGNHVVLRHRVVSLWSSGARHPRFTRRKGMAPRESGNVSVLCSEDMSIRSTHLI